MLFIGLLKSMTFVSDEIKHFIGADDVANILGDTLLCQNPPLTVGVFGKWNSGKTQLLYHTRGGLCQVVIGITYNSFCCTAVVAINDVARNLGGDGGHWLQKPSKEYGMLQSLSNICSSLLKNIYRPIRRPLKNIAKEGCMAQCFFPPQIRSW